MEQQTHHCPHCDADCPYRVAIERIFAAHAEACRKVGEQIREAARSIIQPHTSEGLDADKIQALRKAILGD